MILFHYMYIHINQLLSELCQLGDLCIDQKGTQVSVVLSALPVSSITLTEPPLIWTVVNLSHMLPL